MEKKRDEGEREKASIAHCGHTEVRGREGGEEERDKLMTPTKPAYRTQIITAKWIVFQMKVTMVDMIEWLNLQRRGYVN